MDKGRQFLESTLDVLDDITSLTLVIKFSCMASKLGNTQGSTYRVLSKMLQLAAKNPYRDLVCWTRVQFLSCCSWFHMHWNQVLSNWLNDHKTNIRFACTGSGKKNFVAWFAGKITWMFMAQIQIEPFFYTVLLQKSYIYHLFTCITDQQRRIFFRLTRCVHETIQPQYNTYQ